MDMLSVRAYVRTCTVLILLTGCVAWAAPTPASAQAPATGMLTGDVVHAETEAPLPDVNVVVEDAGRGTATDSDGRYEIVDLTPGTYVVRVSAVGYQAAEQSVTIEADETTVASFALQPARVALDQVDVFATALEERLTTRIGQEELDALPLQDVGEALQTVTGINLQRRGGLGLDPNVRGLTGTQVSTFVDGMRSFGGGPARMDTPLSHIDPASVQRMDVVRGPYALAQGPSLSSIRVDTRASIPNTLATGTLRTGFVSNRDAVDLDGRLLGRSGRLFYDVGGAYRTGDDYTAGDGTTVRGEFESTEVRARVGVELPGTSRLSAQASFQDQGNIAYPGRPLDAVYFETIRGALTYEWYGTGTLQRFEAQGYGYQTLHRMNNDNKRTAEPDPDRMPPMALYITNDTEIATVGGRALAELQLAPDFTLNVGTSGYSALRTATRERGPRTEDGSQGPVMHRDIVWPDVRTTEIGGFAKLERVFGQAEATATGRLDVVHTDPQTVTDGFRERAEAARGLTLTGDLATTDVLWSAAASATVPLVAPLSVIAGVGSSARAPEPLERFGDRVGATRTQRGNEFMGNPTLNPERTYQADLGLEAATPRFTGSVTGFVRHHDDYITIIQAPGVASALPLTPDIVFTYANGQATFWGVEAEAHAQVHPTLRVRASGEYLWGRDESFEDDEPAYGVMPAQLRLGARWMPVGDTFFLDGSLRAVAEQTRVATIRNEGETDGFTTVNVTAGAQLLSNVSLRVGVTNVFDTTYREHLNARSFQFDALQADQNQAFIPEPGRSAFVRVQYGF
ncbi:MAG: TonB-dependent receptor [Longimonas sp.]|uniref:TonB-dependent receptor n=1 Tax=Longimonas sp. TaxID=2039626 RepID=UPI0033517E42